jgi:ATP-dependent RNA circularization protein (DNA/RNA ligase family)
MKAKPKPGLKEGQMLEANGHEDEIVQGMLHDRVMFLEPYIDAFAAVVPDWYVETKIWGYNWHISWLDVVEE